MKTRKKSNSNKRKMKELRKKGKYHNSEMKKLNKEESRIMKKEGYEEKSHKLIWGIIIIAIIVAVVWFFIMQ